MPAAALHTTEAKALLAATLLLCSPQDKQQQQLLAAYPFTPEMLLTSLVV
jgi:hypothetical protein